MVETTYSFSRITTFSECPLKYKLAYLDRRSPTFTPVEFFVGNVVHGALRWLYEQGCRGARPTPAELTATYLERWQQGSSTPIRVVKANDSLEAERAAGLDMLQRHHREVFQADRLATLALEEKFTITLAGQYRYTGVVDRLAQDGTGTLHLIDFKTTGRPPLFLDEKTALQLRSYALGMFASRPVTSLCLSYQYLRTSATLSENYAESQVSQTTGRIVGMIEEATRATSFPAQRSGLCPWCGYSDYCAVATPGATNHRREASGNACPLCGAALARRHGRRGPFIGCTTYPRCRYTRDVTPGESAGDGDSCPLCGGALELRHGKRGDFLGCENFPGCRYSRDA
ncbi:MAG: topoisomerase DNA-binding C4 zinc finger domain-containing protein [Acidobacteria bacterium]|nr:topoisomerase DNA-binding C4 zinc finger domain-containing protein [Acidobacteriota bacterium]